MVLMRPEFMTLMYLNYSSSHFEAAKGNKNARYVVLNRQLCIRQFKAKIYFINVFLKFISSDR